MISIFLSQGNKSRQSNISDDIDLLGNTDTSVPQSIIMRIWIEPHNENEPLNWHGHMTLIESEERIYVKSLREVTHFLATYLHQAGARLPLLWQIRFWLQSLRTRYKKSS